MNDLFEGCRAKFERADNRLKEFEQDVGSAATENVYGITSEDDPITGEYVVRALLPHDLFLQYSVTAGEIIHQLRSSLGHLVWQLIIANGGSHKEGITGFPAFHDEAMYKNRGLQIIAGVSGSDAKIIEESHPFHSNDYMAHPLYVLNQLWNLDKHRLLIVAGVALRGYSALYIYPSGRTERVVKDIDPGLAKDGAELFRFRHPSDFGPNVRIAEVFAWTLIFSQTGPATGQSALELLSRLRNFVDGIIQKLAM